MAARFGATINAINKGLENVKPAQGAHLVEDWETALSEVEAPGAKGLLRDLGALKKQLEKDQPDEARVRTLLHRLGEATVKAAGRVEGKNGDKIRELGEALQETGDRQEDEPEDEEAKKAPKRRTAKKDAAPAEQK